MIACKGLSASWTFRGNFMCAIYGGHAGADRRTGQARELKAHFFKKMCIFTQRQPYSRQFRVFQFFMVQFFLNARISYLLTVFSYLGHNSIKKKDRRLVFSRYDKTANRYEILAFKKNCTMKDWNHGSCGEIQGKYLFCPSKNLSMEQNKR